MPGMGIVARPMPQPTPQPRPMPRPAPGGSGSGSGISITRPQPLPQPGRPSVGVRPPITPPVQRPFVPPVTRPALPQRPTIVPRPGVVGGNNTVINRPITNVTNITQINNIQNNIHRPNVVYPGMGAWTTHYVSRWRMDVPNFYRYYYRPYPWYHGSWHWNWVNYQGVVPWYVYSSLAFRYGYWNFYNPFWVAPVVQPVVYLNYSQPVAAPPPQWDAGSGNPGTAPPVRSINQQALAWLEQAQKAFRQRQYTDAQRQVEAALALAPQEAVLHEFRALVLFARGQFADAAAALYAVLAVHPGWNWTTMSGFYADLNDYQRQFQALAAARDANPSAANLQFLYAYHCLTAGKADQAKEALAAAHKSLPDDPIISQLLLALGAAPAAPAPPTPAAAKVDLDLKGLWKADRSGGRAVYLKLDDQSRFEWESLGGPAKDAFAGNFAVDDTTLTLDRTDGGALVGQVVPQSPTSFVFRLIGAPPQDKGLLFERVAPAP
jgi:tetratricopeptide (TPR) repeat protein